MNLWERNRCHRPKPDRQPMAYYTTHHSVLCIASNIGLSQISDAAWIALLLASRALRLGYISLDCLRLAFILGLEFLVKKIENLAEWLGGYNSRLVVRLSGFESFSCRLCCNFRKESVFSTSRMRYKKFDMV